MLGFLNVVLAAGVAEGAGRSAVQSPEVCATVARLLSGFGCAVLYHKPRPADPAQEAALGVRYASMPELLAQSDVVSLHCPLTPETAGLIDRAALSSMKRSAILVNVARGGGVQLELPPRVRRGTGAPTFHQSYEDAVIDALTALAVATAAPPTTN